MGARSRVGWKKLIAATLGAVALLAGVLAGSATVAQADASDRVVSNHNQVLL
ncbi:hypothetical protein GCM10029976_094480 [Kribbella albertanoniae]|uniref:hypothetical protein n=1 Tax=Kribbella albertanoniae TaxID=1266829 RepID=UPI001404DA5E|nr:hypothetical protein [Kribbella albertanoniae]